MRQVRPLQGKTVRTGTCYICGKELRGNIDFSKNVQCWVCTDRRALYYQRVKLEQQERDKAAKLGITVEVMRAKHAKFRAAGALGGKKSSPPRGEGGGA